MSLSLMFALLTVPQATPAPAVVTPPLARPAMASPDTLPQPAISPKAETGCGYIYAVATPAAPAAKGKGRKGAATRSAPTPAAGTQTLAYQAVLGLKVMGGPMDLQLPKTSQRALAWRCTRDTIVPADFDGRVVLASRTPLRLTDGSRIGQLSLNSAGAFTYGLLRGPLSDAEKDAIQKRLNIFTARLALAASKARAATPAAPGKPKG